MGDNVSVLYAADIDNKAEVSCNQFIDQFCYVSAHGQFALSNKQSNEPLRQYLTRVDEPFNPPLTDVGQLVHSNGQVI